MRNGAIRRPLVCMSGGHPHSTRRIAIAAVVVTASALVVTVALVSRSTGAGPQRVAQGSTATPGTTAPSATTSTTAPSATTSATAPTTQPATTSTPTRTPTPANPTPAPKAALPPTEPFTDDAAVQSGVAAVDQLDEELPADVQVGIAVQDRVTGKLIAGKYSSQQYYSASVVKLFLIDEILRQSEAGTIRLTATDRALIKRALSASDDNAMDSLWVTFNGPAALAELITSLKLTETTAPTDTAQWGETTTSAHDVIVVYDDVLDHLTATNRNLVVSSLAAATDAGADGFDQAFGLLVPPRMDTVKAKQGWMSYGPTYLLHTTGLLGSDNRYVVAILTVQSAGAGWDSARTVDNNAVKTLLTAGG